jgi:hypothetical protein
MGFGGHPLLIRHILISDMDTEVIYERDGYIRNPKAGIVDSQEKTERIEVLLDTDYTD